MGALAAPEWLDRSLEWLQGVAWLRLDLLLRLLLAAVLGGVVGLEREVSGKPAGFRTNLLICVGAALLTELSIGVARMADPRFTNADPARIAAQIVTGVGFLGAGTIIQSRGSVVGLTTAATLWVVAAIGMAVGASAYVEAVGTTLLVIVALVVLGRVEEAIIRRRFERRILITMDVEPGLLSLIRDTFREAGFSVTLAEVEREPDRIGAAYEISGPRDRWAPVLDRLMHTPGIRKVSQV